MKERDLLRFQGPLGTFFLREDSERPVILVAGGTGFAPIKAILEHAFARGMARPFHLYWGARGRRDLYSHDLPQAWVREHANFRYTPVLSEPSAEDHWSGRTGWVHEAVVADYPDLSRHELYASGPPPMVEALKQAVNARGLSGDRLYYDSFEPAHAAAG
jgi:CDP-4-dehydro-6-deoxyglucose reductase, E3